MLGGTIAVKADSQTCVTASAWVSSNSASRPPGLRRSQNSSAPSPLPATASVPPAPTARLLSSCPGAAAKLRHTLLAQVSSAIGYPSEHRGKPYG